MTVSSSDEVVDQTGEARRVALATFLGTTLEWYDFYLYAAMSALVFGPLFFPTNDPVAGTLAALATFAVGFVARPVGGVIAGHFGDRYGRKRMLVITLVVMGVATVGIGLLPTYATVGPAAPILLVVLRILQGLAMGGEWGGAVSMAIEHAPAHRQVLYSTAPTMGSPAGVVLANVVLLVLVSTTGDAFVEWGWRIGFLGSVVLVAVGLWSRRRVTESPLFEAQVAKEPPRLPVAEVLRRHPRALLGSLVVAGVPGISTYIVLTFLLNYGTTQVGYDRQALLLVGIAVCVLQLVAIPVLGRWADSVGPRRLILLGSAAQGLTALVLFPVIDSGSILATTLICLVSVFPTGLVLAAVPVVLATQFPAELRYSGISLAYQLGSIVGGGLAPLIATAILAATGSSLFIGVYMAAACVVMLLCAVSLRRYPAPPKSGSAVVDASRGPLETA